MERKYFKTFLFSFICSILIGNCQLIFAEQSEIDSLKAELKKELSDTTRIKVLNRLGEQFRFQNPDTAILLGKQALSILSDLRNEEQMKQYPSIKHIIQKLTISTHHNLGVYYYFKSDYPLSLTHNLKALEIRKQLSNRKGIASSLGNIGNIYKDQSDYSKALQHYFEAMQIYNELSNKRGIAIQLGNIGIVYWNQGAYTKALQHYLEYLEIARELGIKQYQAIALGNIGILYMEQGDFVKTLQHYFEALEISKELGNKNHIAAWLGNIGIVYMKQAEAVGQSPDSAVYREQLYSKALQHYFKALAIAKELEQKRRIATWLGDIGILYTKQKKHDEAEEFLLQAIALCESIGALNDKIQFEKIISDDLYTQTHNYPLALYHYKEYSATKDSIFNEEKAKDIGRLEQTHEFELAEIQRKKQEEEQARILAEQTQRRNQLQYSGIVLVLVGLFIGIFLFARRFRKIKEYKTFRQYTKIVEAALFISFLIFFEFILVILDPYIEQITGNEPLWKLG
ncbi:MAG: tetratricopeptide repeat protein, partial [Bacteroidia bacterium]|nr:tetratricopeptide repeat protein [Bacteroidia bacterium]